MIKPTVHLMIALTILAVAIALVLIFTSGFVSKGLTFFSWRLLLFEFLSVIIAMALTTSKRDKSFAEIEKGTCFALGSASFAAFFLAASNTSNSDHTAIRRLWCGFESIICNAEQLQSNTFQGHFFILLLLNGMVLYVITHCKYKQPIRSLSVLASILSYMAYAVVKSIDGTLRSTNSYEFIALLVTGVIFSLVVAAVITSVLSAYQSEHTRKNFTKITISIVLLTASIHFFNIPLFDFTFMTLGAVCPDYCRENTAWAGKLLAALSIVVVFIYVLSQLDLSVPQFNFTVKNRSFNYDTPLKLVIYIMIIVGLLLIIRKFNIGDLGFQDNKQHYEIQFAVLSPYELSTPSTCIERYAVPNSMKRLGQCNVHRSKKFTLLEAIHLVDSPEIQRVALSLRDSLPFFLKAQSLL